MAILTLPSGSWRLSRTLISFDIMSPLIFFKRHVVRKQRLIEARQNMGCWDGLNLLLHFVAATLQSALIAVGSNLD